MLNLFKSQETLVREIHNEFDTAEDRLLKQADDVIADLNIPTESKIEERASRLAKIGFVKSEAVQQADTLVKKRKEISDTVVKSKEQAELIKYYKQAYPFIKFITEDEMDRICEKYKLIYAPVSNYTKDVPEKNISDIEKAPPIKYGDGVKDINLYKPNANNVRKDCPDNVKRAFMKGIPIEGNEHWYQAAKNVEKTFGVRMKDCVKYESLDYKIESQSKSGLFIAAPKSHFDLTGLSSKGKYGFLSMQIMEVKDPIVFRYVRGGIQIITKWGLEAEDKDLVNEKMN